MAKFIRFFFLVLALSFTTNNAFGIDYIVDFDGQYPPFSYTQKLTSIKGITWEIKSKKINAGNKGYLQLATTTESDLKIQVELTGFKGVVKSIIVGCWRTQDKPNKDLTLSISIDDKTFGNTLKVKKGGITDHEYLEFEGDTPANKIVLTFTQPDKNTYYGLYLSYIKVVYDNNITLDEAEDNGTILKDNLNKWANITLNRNFTNDGWYTLCLPFNLNSTKINSVFGDKTEVEEFAKVVTNDGVKELQFTTTDNIQAGIPYIIKPTKENIAKPTFSEVMISAASPSSVEHDGYQFVGTYSATEIEADDKYKLLGGNDGTVIANVSEAGTLKGTRCYFLFPSGSQPVNKSIGLGLPTAIHPNTYTVKQANEVYTLQGIKINDATNLPSGIYVRNGKKFIIK